MPSAPTVTATPSPDVSPSPSATPAPPSCTVADVITAKRDYAHPELTILDTTYALPADYVPPDLVGARTGTSAAAADVPLVRALLYADLGALRDAANAARVTLTIVSAYRSYVEQKETFDHWASVGGYEQALRSSARPGHSEHQLGTAVDFGDGTKLPWEYEDWATTPTGAWLVANAAEFGFVMSYPKGALSLTCYDYEPWHYRWVGRELAAKVAASGMPLRQYLETLR